MAQGSIRVLQTVEHTCGYYPERRARNLVIDPSADHLEVVFNAVITSGFRRAGDLVFRPHCRNCQACEATRIPVGEFEQSRNQKRCRQRNEDVSLCTQPGGFSEEYFELYRRYVNSKHAGGGMDQPLKEDFEGFLLSDWSDTFFLEFRVKEQLIGVAVTDRLSSGLSAVYCFWDPDEGARSLGTLAILTQIDLAVRQGLPYVYLGYWIDQHPKMHYKVQFRPIELFRDGNWVRYQPESDR